MKKFAGANDPQRIADHSPIHESYPLAVHPPCGSTHRKSSKLFTFHQSPYGWRTGGLLTPGAMTLTLMGCGHDLDLGGKGTMPLTLTGSSD